MPRPNLMTTADHPVRFFEAVEATDKEWTLHLEYESWQWNLPQSVAPAALIEAWQRLVKSADEFLAEAKACAST